MEKEEAATPSAAWNADTLNFAVAELHREFPLAPSAMLASAVERASREVNPADGRVKLLQKSREELRRHADS